MLEREAEQRALCSNSLEEMTNKIKASSHIVKQKGEKMKTGRRKKKGNVEAQFQRPDCQLTRSFRKREKTEARVNYQSKSSGKFPRADNKFPE